VIAILAPMPSPTTEQVACHLAELRRVMALDLPTLAGRAKLEPQVLAEIEAGTREWTLDELLAIAFGLGVTITSIFRRFDPPRG
jgi:hypothetical protein